MLFYAVVWSIWKARNECVFDKKSFRWKEVADLVKVRIAIWAAARETSLVFSINDRVRNITES